MKKRNQRNSLRLCRKLDNSRQFSAFFYSQLTVDGLRLTAYGVEDTEMLVV